MVSVGPRGPACGGLLAGSPEIKRVAATRMGVAILVGVALFGRRPGQHRAGGESIGEPA